MREKIIERLQGDRWERVGYLVDEILDMPVDGVQVRNTTGTTQFVCPLTIGEALEILPRMVTGLKSMSNGDAFLTIIDGGIVEVFDDSKD
jgi:hypothetical protein